MFSLGVINTETDKNSKTKSQEIYPTENSVGRSTKLNSHDNLNGLGFDEYCYRIQISSLQPCNGTSTCIQNAVFTLKKEQLNKFSKITFDTLQKFFNIINQHMQPATL